MACMVCYGVTWHDTVCCYMTWHGVTWYVWYDIIQYGLSLSAWTRQRFINQDHTP
jgi:hypothetical protein